MILRFLSSMESWLLAARERLRFSVTGVWASRSARLRMRCSWEASWGRDKMG